MRNAALEIIPRFTETTPQALGIRRQKKEEEKFRFWIDNTFLLVYNINRVPA